MDRRVANRGFRLNLADFCYHPNLSEIDISWKPVSTWTEPSKLRLQCVHCQKVILSFATTVINPMECPIERNPRKGDEAIRLPNGLYLNTTKMPPFKVFKQPQDGGILIEGAQVCLHCISQPMEVDLPRDCKLQTFKKQI